MSRFQYRSLSRIALTGVSLAILCVASGCSAINRLSQIGEMRPRRLVFEMSQVAYLDCASARLIAGTGDWLPAGVKPVVSRPSPIVRRVLQASGIGAFCELEP